MKKAVQNGDILGMTGRGTRGGEPRADGSPIEAGIHLRWQMTPEIGFPPGGFNIYRREEDYKRYLKCGTLYAPDLGGAVWTPDDSKGSPRDLAIEPSGETRTVHSCAPDKIFTAQFIGHQEIRFVFAKPTRYVRIRFGEGTVPTPEASAYWQASSGDVLMGTARAKKRRNLVGLQLFADRIDSLVLRGEDIVICRFCFVLVQDGYDSSWGEPLNGNTPIYLPVTHPEWSAPHPNAPDDQAEAEDRLPDALSADTWQEYADGFRDELHPVLYDLARTESHHLHRFQETDQNSDANLDWSGMNLMQLMALDPNIARILGLYWHDEPPSPDTYYDYRVVGYYEDTHYPGLHVQFEDLEPGARYGTLFEKEGVGFASPNPIDVVHTAWDGSEHTALLFTRNILLAPISVQLPPGVTGLTLRLDAERAFTVKAYNDTYLADTFNRLAGDHTLHIDYGKRINKLLILPLGDITLVEMILRKEIEGMGDVTYQVYHLRSNTEAAVATTVLEPPHVESAATGIDENGLLTENQSRVGLRWERFEAGGARLLAGAPLLYQVQRASVDDEGNLGDSILLNEDNPAIVSLRNDDGTGPPRPYYSDLAVPDGRYAYRVRGIDIFGLLSEWCDPQEVAALDRRPPPPPQALQAAYLDPADPYLSDEDKAWADAEGPGLKISWEWPGICRLQAPDVAPEDAEFRVYVQMGELNAVRGTVTSIVDRGTWSLITTNLNWPGAADALAGESIRVNRHFFEIIGNTTGGNCAISVNHLTSPALAPAPGPMSITLSSDRSYWKDFALTENWESRLHAEPAADILLIDATVTAADDFDPAAPDAVITRPGATRTITLDQPLDDNDAVLTPGVLFCDGRAYRAYGHTESNQAKIHIVPAVNPTNSAKTIEPVISAACKYYPGRRYEVRLPDIPLVIPPGDASASAHVAVSASDGKVHSDDNPVWSQPGRGGLGGRPGNEGPPSPAVKVMAVPHTAPPTVGNIPQAADPIVASPADYYGRARYTLAWDATPDVAGYAVYRCSGGLLFETDRLQRERQTGPYQNGNAFFDDPGIDAWLADYDPNLTTADLQNAPEAHRAAWRAWATQFYDSRTDLQIQDIAGREGNQIAYRRFNKEAVTVSSYADVLDGRGQGIYLYRVRTLDAAGNLSAWSAAFPPVHLFDITPPAMPVVTEVRGGEKFTAITWRANTEKDLQEYRVWRDIDAALLSDVRRQPATSVAPGPGAVMTYVDDGLAGLQTYFYRVAAVDASGNVSAPTAILAARVADSIPPNPPVWERSEWMRLDSSGTEYAYDNPIAQSYDPAVALRWLTDQIVIECVVERRSQFESFWTSIAMVTEPLNAADADSEDARRYAIHDLSASTLRNHTYRVRVKSPAGLINTKYFNLSSVSAAPQS